MALRVIPPTDWIEGDGDYYVNIRETPAGWQVHWLWYPDEGYGYQDWVFATETEARTFAADLIADGHWALDAATWLSNEEVERRFGFRHTEG